MLACIRITCKLSHEHSVNKGFITENFRLSAHELLYFTPRLLHFYLFWSAWGVLLP